MAVLNAAFSWIKWLFKNVSLNLFLLMLVTALAVSMVTAITYTNIHVNMQIVKQMEKINRDPDDLKSADMVGLDQFCTDARLRWGNLLILPEIERDQIKKDCDVIHEEFDKLRHAKITTK